MRVHEEEQREYELVVDREEEEVISVHCTRPFPRSTSIVDGSSGIDAITVGGECIDESRPVEQESSGVNYVLLTEEPRECSQADAFDVIEHLVALDDVELLGRADYTKAVKEISPCVLTVKGVHTLARRIGLMRSASDMGRFEWVDVNRCKELEDGNGGSGRKRSKIKCMDAISEACPSPLGSESRYEEEIKYQDGQSVEACTGGSEIEFIRDLDRNLEVEALRLQLNAHPVNGATEDDCDVGFATQIAAEAMEVLSHAPSGSSCSSFSPGLQTSLIPFQSCFSSLDGSSSGKNRSCSELARLTQHSKEMDDLLKSSGHLEKDSSRRSSTFFRQSIGKRTKRISGRTKQKDAALGSPTSSEYIVLLKTENEAKCNNKGNAPVKGWSQSKAKFGRIKHRFPGENVVVDIVGKVGRSKEIVGETGLFDNRRRFKYQELSPSSESWSYPKRKRTRVDSRRLSNGAIDTKLSASQTLFKNKLNGNGSNRDDYPSKKNSGTLTIGLNNDGCFLAPEKAKRSCLTGACSVNNFLSRDKSVDIGGADGAKFLTKSKVEHAKDQPSSRSVDIANIMNVTFGSIVSKGCGDLKMKQNKKHPNTFWLRELNRLGVSNDGPNFKRQDLRKQRHMAYVRVLLSLHLEEAVIRQQMKMMLRLAIPMAASMDEATHFVAENFVRTRNMLEAIALGKPVVTPLWLESCLQAGYLIAEKNFIMRDEKMEKKFAFDLPSSLARAKQYPLLEGKKVVITPSTGPDKEMILRLIEAVHGQAIETSDPTVIKDEDSIDKLLVISCVEDRAIYSRFLETGVAVYSSELLLNGIVTQKIDYERYLLHGGEVDPA